MILFATHGNSTVGMGHVVRTLTLAQELRRQTDEPILFDLPAADGVARYQMLAAGFGFWEGQPPRLVVSDYADSSAKAVTGSVGVVLADVADECEARDVTILATHGKCRLPDVWAGPEYAILRQQFAQARGTFRQFRAGVPQLLLSFGGADPANLTEAATVALAATPYRLTAILGPAYPHAKSYIERWGTRVTIHRPDVSLLTTMADYMRSADLLVCSGGMTPVEAACVGTPTLVIAQNDREHERMLRWQHAWTGYYLGPWHSVRYVDVQAAVVKLMADPETLDAMSLRGPEVVDGMGAWRCAKVLLSLAAFVSPRVLLSRPREAHA